MAKHRVIKPFPVPLRRVDSFIRIVQHTFFSHLFNNFQYLTFQVLTSQESPALLIDDFTLFVNYVIIFQQMFSDVEVMALDSPLGIFDSPGDEPGLYGFSLLHAQPVHYLLYALCAENAQEVIFEREEKSG